MDSPGAISGRIAGAAVVAFSAVFALRRIDDFDTWWHLAAGRWIAGHAAVPATDTLSHTVRDHAWVNLQWGFDLALFALHQVGGPALLAVAAAVGFAVSILLVLRLCKPHLGDVGAVLLILGVVFVAQERFAVRPEMLSFPLLASLLMVLSSGARHEGRGLWRLVPLMVVWVNVHALFVVGVFAIVCAMAGSLLAARSRGIFLWGGAALASVLANPFGLAGALFPLKLLTRIDGSEPTFQTIAEFRSPFAPDAAGIAIVAYKVFLAVACAAAVATILLHFLKGRASRGPAESRLDYGGLAFFAGLAGLSLAARRNDALFAVGTAPFVASCLGTVFEALPGGVRDAVRRRAPLTAGVVIGLAAVLAASIVTGALYRWDNQAKEFGWGVVEGTFPIRAAAAAREAKLPPTLYNDVAAGGYLAWDDPVGGGVFIDGRLEVYDAPFFSDYVAGMYDPARFEAAAARYGVQTVILFHRWENRRRLVDRLFHGGSWALVYADEVAAVFVRAAGNEAVFQRTASMTARWNDGTRAWLARPAPRWPYPAGRVEGTRAFARFLATIDDPEGAVSAYENLLTLGVAPEEEVDVRLLLARRFAATGRLERARVEARRILTIAPQNGEAQKLLQ